MEGTAHCYHKERYITDRPSKDEVIIGITIDSNLSSADHIDYVCSKRNQILLVLARDAIFINTEKKKMYNQTFIQSQFE